MSPPSYKMMYDLTLLKQSNLPLSWEEVYAGIVNGLLTPQSAEQHASDLAAKDQLADNLIDLLWETNDKNRILKIIEKTLAQTMSENSLNLIKKKLRYAILNDLKNKEDELDKKKILSLIDIIYENFGCPPDMESFIYYLPSTDASYDPSLHSPEENQKHLIDKFHIFLAQEKADLEKL